MSKYVKEYKGHKVPEGAVYYGPETISNHEGFFDEEKCYLGIIVDGVFKPVFGQEKCSRLDIIELPLAEYVPEVGEVCECTWGFKRGWHEAVIIPQGRIVILDARLLKGSSTEDIRNISDMDGIEFRPIKSEREKFIEKVKEINKAHHWSLDELAEALYEAGFKAPIESSTE